MRRWAGLVALLAILVPITGCDGSEATPEPFPSSAQYSDACALIHADELAALTDKGTPVPATYGASQCVWKFAGAHHTAADLRAGTGPLPDLSGGGFIPLDGFERTTIWRPGSLVVSVAGRRATLHYLGLYANQAVPPEEYVPATKYLARLLNERLPRLAPEALPKN